MHQIRLAIYKTHLITCRFQHNKHDPGICALLQDGAPGVVNNEDAAAKVLEEQYWYAVWLPSSM